MIIISLVCGLIFAKQIHTCMVDPIYFHASSLSEFKINFEPDSPAAEGLLPYLLKMSWSFLPGWKVEAFFLFHELCPSVFGRVVILLFFPPAPTRCGESHSGLFFSRGSRDWADWGQSCSFCQLPLSCEWRSVEYLLAVGCLLLLWMTRVVMSTPTMVQLSF